VEATSWLKDATITVPDQQAPRLLSNPFTVKRSPSKPLTDVPDCVEGDGEISFCGAIEIAGIITIKFDVIKGGQEKLGMVNGKSPIFLPGPVQPQFGPGRMLYVRTTSPLFCVVQC
jgi:hypothetical protein